MQEELGLNMYDYGARNYDPALGRWMNIDPLAETSRRWNPYNYCYNSPMTFVDPDGMQADDWKKNINGQVVYDKTLTSTSPLGFGETYLGKTHQEVSWGAFGPYTHNYYMEDGNVVSFGDNYQGGGSTEYGSITGDDLRVFGNGGLAFADGGNSQNPSSIPSGGRDVPWLDFGGALEALKSILGFESDRSKPTGKGTNGGKSTVQDKIDDGVDAVDYISGAASEAIKPNRPVNNVKKPDSTTVETWERGKKIKTERKATKDVE